MHGGAIGVKGPWENGVKTYVRNDYIWKEWRKVANGGKIAVDFSIKRFSERLRGQRRNSPSHGASVRWIPWNFRRTIVEYMKQLSKHNKYEFRTTIPYVTDMKSNKQNGVETGNKFTHKRKYLLGKTTTQESLLWVTVFYCNLFIHRYQALQMGASAWDCFPIQFTNSFSPSIGRIFYTILMLRQLNKNLLQVTIKN